MGFLIYRVELKEYFVIGRAIPIAFVPNLPCGVESRQSLRKRELFFLFLIYRVELKAIKKA